MYKTIIFWPRTCSGWLLVDLVNLGPKMFKNKDEPFALTIRLGKNSPSVLLHHWFYKTMENGRLLWDNGCCIERRTNLLIVFAVASS